MSNLATQQAEMRKRLQRAPMVPRPARRVYGVYVFQVNEFYKIGYACDISRRLAEIQTASPYKVVMRKVYTLGHPTAAARAERTLHTLFEARHIRGEWFMLTADDLAHLDEIAKQLSLDAEKMVF